GLDPKTRRAPFRTPQGLEIGTPEPEADEEENTEPTPEARFSDADKPDITRYWSNWRGRFSQAILDEGQKGVVTIHIETVGDGWCRIAGVIPVTVTPAVVASAVVTPVAVTTVAVTPFTFTPFTFTPFTFTPFTFTPFPIKPTPSPPAILANPWIPTSTSPPRLTHLISNPPVTRARGHDSENFEATGSSSAGEGMDMND
ncbi:hypothetical protein V497_03879, partial [Pseudogymnoascus sp. VKM F-4516 (FW-969)]